jgi:hypothetical protein
MAPLEEEQKEKSAVFAGAQKIRPRSSFPCMSGHRYVLLRTLDVCQILTKVWEEEGTRNVEQLGKLYTTGGRMASPEPSTPYHRNLPWKSTPDRKSDCAKHGYLGVNSTNKAVFQRVLR